MLCKHNMANLDYKPKIYDTKHMASLYLWIMTHVAQIVGFVESCSGSQCHDVDFLDLVSHPYLEWLNSWSLTVFVDSHANRNLDAAWEVYKVAQCIVSILLKRRARD